MARKNIKSKITKLIELSSDSEDNDIEECDEIIPVLKVNDKKKIKKNKNVVVTGNIPYDINEIFENNGNNIKNHTKSINRNIRGFGIIKNKIVHKTVSDADFVNISFVFIFKTFTDKP